MTSVVTNSDGYTLTFLKGGTVTIKNGVDGINGTDGANGADGHSPVISVKKGSDGRYYWTLDGEYLLDTDGNPLPVTGSDGKDGADGTDGADGQTSYIGFNGNWWIGTTDTGVKATGSDGKDGADGTNGTDGKNGASCSITITEDAGGNSYTATIINTDSDGNVTSTVMSLPRYSSAMQFADGYTTVTVSQYEKTLTVKLPDNLTSSNYDCLMATVTPASGAYTCGTSLGWTVSVSSPDFTTGQTSVTVAGGDPLTDGDQALLTVMLVYKDGTQVSTSRLLEYALHEAVDLGLSVKWASCNVGAASPEEYGCYYAMGETEEKEDYTQATYKFSLFDTEGNFTGYSDIGSDIAGTEYDVAHVKWGEKWKMPTKDQIVELVQNCTWTWTTQNNVSGYEITGSNGNSIFLPAAGWRKGISVDKVGSSGYYWSSVVTGSNNVYGYFIYIKSSSKSCSCGIGRYYGFPVRPVTE